MLRIESKLSQEKQFQNGNTRSCSVIDGCVVIIRVANHESMGCGFEGI